MIPRFKRIATAGIWIHPTKAWLSQLVNFTNAIWTVEEQYAIKLCFKLGKSVIRWKRNLLLWPRRPDRANPPTNFWWSLFLIARPWSTCTVFSLDRQSTRNTMLRFYGRSGKRFRRKRPALFKSGQWHFQQNNAPVPQLHPWPRWASRQFLSLPIVQTLLPVTFGYSLSSEAVVMRQLRRWKKAVTKVIDMLTQEDSTGPS